MQLLALVALTSAALPPASLPQSGTAPPKPGVMKRLFRTMEKGTEARAEDAADELERAGVAALPLLEESLVRVRARVAEGESTQEAEERIHALRLRIAASDDAALPVLLEHAGDERSVVSRRVQYALSVLPTDPTPRLVERWDSLSTRQRENAVLAAVASDAPEAHDLLVAILSSIAGESSSARLRAALGLRRFPARDDAIDALGAAAVGSDPSSAMGACGTLWSYGARGVPGLLAATRRGGPAVRPVAAALLAGLGDIAAGPVLAALEENAADPLVLRVASIVAPNDPATTGAFLQAATSDSYDVRSELLWALPRLDLPGGIRGELVANSLERTSLVEVEEALRTALQLPDDEFRALEGPLRSAWLRADPGETLVRRAGAALKRLDLPPSELIELCGRRIRMEDTHAKLAAAVLLGDLPDTAEDELAAAIRGSDASDLPYWSSALIGRGPRSEALLVELTRAAEPAERPYILGHLAFRSGLGEEALQLLAEELEDPTSPGGGAVLRGLAELGGEADGLLDPLLKRFDEFELHVQAPILRAATRCDPSSKRLAAVARAALANSPADQVRASAASALRVGHGTPASRSKVLRAALKRGGLPKSSFEKKRKADSPIDRAKLDLLLRRREGNVPETVSSAAMALALLEDHTGSSIDLIGRALAGHPAQTILCAEALRRLSPHSAVQGEALADQAWHRDMLARTACVRALAEIEGASAHAESVLASVALVQNAELAALALDGLEALSPDERGPIAPYLNCIARRNTWPMDRVGWVREVIDEPWAIEYEILGPAEPLTQTFAAFDALRARARALLESR
ncbi:MAG: hypothetical protein AAFU73_03570 [Planctomycetota bacterium]